MAQDLGFSVTADEQPWKSSFNKQQRADVGVRTAKIIPREKLVTKKGRYFTTEISTVQLQKEIQSVEAQKKVASKPLQIEVKAQNKKTFTAKNN